MIGSAFSKSSQCRQPVLLVALALGLVWEVSAFGADTTPPELKALVFAPAAIDTSSSAAEVTLGFTVSDDASGVNYLEAVFVDPSGVARQPASSRFAPARDGTYAVKFVFPRFSNAGTWTLSTVFLSDAAGNTLVLDSDGLSKRGFPIRLEVTSARDTVSPKLTALDFAPSRIDTTLGPADVKVNFTATDDLSGVNYIELSFVTPSGVPGRGSMVKVEAARSVSGSTTLTFPRRSEAGLWTLKTVFLSDAAHNTLVLDADALAALGFRTSLEVISAHDTDPPRLTSLHFEPDTIDTSSGPATVQVGFRATDSLSGVKSLEVVFESPSKTGKQRAVAEFPSSNGVGDSVKVVFPRFSEPGQWTLSAAFLADAAGNTLALDADGLAGIGVRTALNVRSAQDTVPPSLTALRFAPNVIDTRRGPAEVQVGFKATDNYSGVKSVEVVFASPSKSVNMRGAAEFPPSGEVSGSVKVTFPPNSEPGTWKMETVVLTDAANNTLVLDADALASRAGVLQVR